MRIGILMVAVALLAVPAMGSAITYPLTIDPARSNISIYIGLYIPMTGDLIETTVGSRVGGSLDLGLDKAAGTAELQGLNAGFLDTVKLHLDGSTVMIDPGDPEADPPVPPSYLGWADIETPYAGSAPLSLSSSLSGGAAPYDGAGNIIFPGVKVAVAGQGMLTGEGTLAGLLAFYLTGGSPPILVDLGKLNLDFTQDLPAVVHPEGGVAGGPAVSIPVNISGENDVLPGTLTVRYSVIGEINTIVPEPVTGGLFVLGMAVMSARLRRRS